jgi:hypothetical protein
MHFKYNQRRDPIYRVPRGGEALGQHPDVPAYAPPHPVGRDKSGPYVLDLERIF